MSGHRESDRVRGTHQLGTIEEGIRQDMARKRPSKALVQVHRSAETVWMGGYAYVGYTEECL